MDIAQPLWDERRPLSFIQSDFQVRLRTIKAYTTNYNYKEVTAKNSKCCMTKFLKKRKTSGQRREAASNQTLVKEGLSCKAKIQSA